MPQPINPTPTNPFAPLFPKPAPQPEAQAPVAAPAQPAQPQAAEASISQQLLGKVGSAQQHALESQQLLGAVTNMFAARISQVGKSVWAMLRGTPPATE
jgi:hypothetical protein